MVGVASPFAGGVPDGVVAPMPPGALSSGPSRNAPAAGSVAPLRTMVGMPAAVMNHGGRLPGVAGREAEQMPPLAGAPQAGERPGPAKTMVGVPPPAGVLAAARAAAGAQVNEGAPAGDPRLGPNTAILGSPAVVIRPSPPASTMIGVAMPGIAPLHDPSGDDEVYADERPSQELGATIAPRDGAMPRRAPEAAPRSASGHAAPPRAPAQARSTRAPRRALLIVAIGAVLGVAAILFAVFWPSAPPLIARARVDAEGKEVVEVRCASCADGTQISLGAASAAMAGGVAAVPVPAPLSVGQNLLKIAVDRPGNGRDETVAVQVPVAYRIRPELSTLQGERPAIQVVIEAVDGTSVAIDGKPVPLTNGRAVETIDVTDACTGLADDQAVLSRQIPYEVKPEDGTPEKGTVNVSVRILPLRIDAPGPHAVIDGKNFVLAGRTLSGSEILVAGRAIAVKPDGSFAQTMNVSSVGATQIEVRAKRAGMAPRLTRIAVRRVDSLEVAAREFAAQQPAPAAWPAIVADLKASVGKPVVLSGEVIDVRRQNNQTILLLDVSPKSGCSADKAAAPSACQARLVQGADNPLSRGDLITAYGQVSRAFPTGAGKPDIPEVQVDFTLKGLR
jgi:hypothetical protein